MSIKQAAAALGISQGERLERWAKDFDRAYAVKDSEIPRQVLHSPFTVGGQTVATPICDPDYVGTSVSSSLTDRRNSQPITRAVQMRQAKT